MPNSTAASGDPGALRFGAARRCEIDAILAIEIASFPTPWNRGHFLHEFDHNPYAANYVLRQGTQLVGYASVWIVDHELQVNKIAIDPSRRREGLARRFMQRLLQLAGERDCGWVTLEVREANIAAIALYRGLDFVEFGRRGDYYGPGQDALLMRFECEI